MNANELKAQVKSLARSCGFDAVGIAPADIPAERTDGLRRWLAAGMHADMTYMTRNMPQPLSPRELVPGAQSVICLVVSYAGDDMPKPADAAAPAVGTIARYARGRDYHRVLKARCIAFMDEVRKLEPSFEGRAFVDSAPIMERTLAAMAGVGFVGENGCVIVPGLGSYVLLCEVVCNLPLPADEPLAGSCDGCGRCRAACPTAAIVAPGVVDARRCISYHTIENRGAIPRELWPKMGTRLFGCDACQEACPHNQVRKHGTQNKGTEEKGTCYFSRRTVCEAPLSGAPSVAPIAPPAPMGKVACPPFPDLPLREVLAWTEADWDARTRGRAIRRATHAMFLRNAAIAAGNSGDASLVERLRALATAHPDLADVAAWAMSSVDKDMTPREPNE